VTTKEHWEQVYAARLPNEVSWYEPNPVSSLSLVAETHVSSGAKIIDVGGGASTLVDHLLDAGFTDLTVLDVAASALRRAEERLGSRSAAVTWLEADVLSCDLPERSFDLWHDRAVFHFLTNTAEQERYVERVERALRLGGHLILATFASDGPTRCSGLDVVRYSPDQLAARFTGFELVEHRSTVHRTPVGNEQRFLYCRFVRVAE
jgi:ubiquinone/menaquinone biosynthesis C-methylase UbiE